MKITPQSDDAPDFVRITEQIANGVLHRYPPETLVLIKIDSWFGSKWLGFSGKTLGAVAVWDKTHIQSAGNVKIPPFVPNRVILQRRFAGPAYEEIDSGKPIHEHIPSTRAVLRRAATVAPGAGLIWYSGNSSTTGRGAVMVYVPVGDSYWPWYAGFAGQPWHVTETCDIKHQDLSALMEEASAFCEGLQGEKPAVKGSS